MIHATIHPKKTRRANDSGFERGVTVSGHIQIHRADL